MSVYRSACDRALDVVVLLFRPFVHEPAVPEVFPETVLNSADRMWKVELSADYKNYWHRVRIALGEFFEQLLSRCQTFRRLLAGSQWQIEVQ